MNEKLAEDFLRWLDVEHQDLINELYEKFKAERKTKTYMVFWTFVANFADYPILVEAKSVEDAIRKGYVYNPEASDDNGNKARFLVVEIGGTVVHNGYFEDIGKEPCVIDAKTGSKRGDDWKKRKEGEQVKAYYSIGGITPIHQLAELFEGNKDAIKYDAYKAHEGTRSNFTISREVQTFEEAKNFFDRITTFLWDTIWKEVDGGYTVCGCADADDGEVVDDQGRDYKEWEEDYE